MVERSQVLDLVLKATRQTVSDRELSFNGDAGEETGLYGREGILDSLALVSLIIDVEQRLETDMDVVVVIANDRAMSQKKSPFSSVRTLTDYICLLINNKNNEENNGQ